MSDDPAAASFLDRVNTLSAPAVVGLGAAAGLLFAVLSALRVEPSSAQEPEPVAAGGGVVQDSPAAPEGNARSAGARTRRGGAAATGRPSAPAVAEHDAAPVVAEPDTDDLIPEDEPTDVEMLEPDLGVALDAQAEDADGGDPAALSDPPPSPAGRTQADRDAEAKMDADELLAAATDAYEGKRYKDAYRLATRSQRSRPRDKAQMLRGRSACRLRDQKNAREIVRSFKLGDEHRKTLRTFCKDRGVRVGL